MNRHHYGLILAGGRGTRFWPRSRKRSSKQVLNVVGERSLIQSTVDRLTPLIPAERLWVLTNDHLRDIIVKQLPEVPRNQILAEPVQRNTAPAIGLAAQILYSLDREAVMGVFPSDHVVGKIPQYRAVIRAAFKTAAERRLVVVGIQPRWPETGYGYIEFPRDCAAGSASSLAVRGFHEKPDLAKAKRYLKAGNFFWNSGMFFWRADVLLDELRRHLPRTATVLASLPRFGSRAFAGRLKQAFPLCDNISIDYAVLEPAAKDRKVVMLSMDAGWSDLGGWPSLLAALGGSPVGRVIKPGQEIVPGPSDLVLLRRDGKLELTVGTAEAMSAAAILITRFNVEFMLPY